MSRHETSGSAGKVHIEWSQLRYRLAQAAERLTQPVADAEARRRILRARACRAARESVPGEDRTAQVPAVEFLLAHERFALETTWVREVVPLRDLTPLPGTPAFVAGLINVRGHILSVVDLKAFFELPAKGLPDLNRVVVLGNGRIEFGLLIDTLIGITNVCVDELQPALPTHSGVRAEYLRGLTPQRLAVLDGARILADPGIVVRQEVP
jgi:purine-binding chemotaxis protein CheW